MNMKEKRPTTHHQQSTHQLAGQPTGPSPFPSPEGRGVDSYPLWLLHEFTSG